MPRNDTIIANIQAYIRKVPIGDTFTSNNLAVELGLKTKKAAAILKWQDGVGNVKKGVWKRIEYDKDE